MPFGLLRCGFLGHTVDVPWCSLRLNLVRTALHHTAQRHRGFQPDFLIPQVGGDVESPIFSSPMSRAQGVILLRRFLLQSNSSADVQFVGVHSCKVTFLAWSRQLAIDSELRRHQGHHRASGPGQCVDLYSRDDVHPALQLQRIVLSKISSGFRPVIPLLRGGAPAVHDKPVVVPPVPPFPDLPIETSISPPALEDLDDTDSNASSEAVLDQDEQAPAPLVIRRCEGVADCLFLLNAHSMVAHFASECDATDAQCICTVVHVCMDTHQTSGSNKNRSPNSLDVSKQQAMQRSPEPTSTAPCSVHGPTCFFLRIRKNIYGQ